MVAAREKSFFSSPEHLNFGSDPFGKLPLGKNGKVSEAEIRVWSLRREIAGRVYEENWRLRNLPNNGI